MEMGSVCSSMTAPECELKDLCLNQKIVMHSDAVSNAIVKSAEMRAAAFLRSNGILSRCALSAAILLIAIIGIFLPIEPAWAVPIQSTSISNGAVNVPVDVGSIEICFGHNVAGTPLFDANASHIAVFDENGQSIGSVYRRYFGGSSPDDANPDYEGYRRYLYVQLPVLDPGSTYTLVVAPGVLSSGAHNYDGLTYTFTTAGTKPEPPVVPEPPDDLEGGGGQGGQGGLDATGGEDGSGNEGQAGGTTPDGSGQNTPPKSNNSGSVAAEYTANSLSPQSFIERYNEMKDMASIEGTATTDSLSSLAAGLGGGKVYAIGDPSMPLGAPTNITTDETFENHFWIPLTAIAFILLFVFGLVFRQFRWKMHVSCPTVKMQTSSAFSRRPE